MANSREYLNKEYLNKVMFECKQKNELTKEAVRCFELLARHVSNSYDYSGEEDRKDAIAFATTDFAAYWRNYKINPLVQIKFLRPLYHGEQFIFIHKGKKKTYTAKQNPKNRNDFGVMPKINQTIENLKNLLDRDSDGSYFTGVHKVTRKLQIVDTTCYSNSKSKVIVNKKVGSIICKDDTNPHIGESHFAFGAPPPAFNFLTSVARNGLFKATKTMYSEGQKLMINFSRINRINGGIYND